MRVTKEEFVKGIRLMAIRQRIAQERAEREGPEVPDLPPAVEAQIEAEIEAEIDIHPTLDPLDPFDV